MASMSEVSAAANPDAAERGSAPRWNIEVVADSDSRWKWGASLARRLAGADAVVTPRVHATLLEGRSSPSDRQLADVGEPADTVHRLALGEAVQRLATTDAEVVVLACLGSGVQALLHGLARGWADRAVRPVVVTGYVGLVYENAVDGLLLRAGADVVLANSAHDTERFRDVFRAAGADPGTIVQTALPFLDGRPYAPDPDRPFTVTYVTQPGVPVTRDERSYALLQAVRHARRHPDRQVVVKLRARAGERTTHVEPHPYPSLLAEHELPANLEFRYGAMGPVLDSTDLCVTVSSTAALEAMHRGIPTAVLTDFGIRESLGNHVFLGCGAFASWRELHDGRRPEVDRAWAEANGVRDQHPYAAAAARVAQLVDGRHRLPALQPGLAVAQSGCYLPALLARHGLAPDGAPLVGPADRVSFGRRAVRSAARRAYGVGLRVLEPRIRRMAQL